jgi:hypothetical protein
MNEKHGDYAINIIILIIGLVVLALILGAVLAHLGF